MGKLGYPYSYGSELTPEMAKSKRNRIFFPILVGLSHINTENLRTDKVICIECIQLQCGRDLWNSDSNNLTKQEIKNLSTNERVISNQELNSLEDYRNSATIIRTGNGTILAFQKEFSTPSSNEILSEHNLNETNEVILVKNDGRLPEVSGFDLNNNVPRPTRRHPFTGPRFPNKYRTDVLPPQGLGNIPKAPQFRSHTDLDTGLDGRRGNRGDQCAAPEHDMKKEFKTFKEDMAQKGIEVNCDQQRFNDLCVNQETGTIDNKSIFEAKGCLQGEEMGMYKNLRRPVNKDVLLDFEAIDTKTGKRLFIDHKGMIDLSNLIGKDGKKIDTSGYPKHEKIAYDMGKKIPLQKKRYVGLPNGPKSPDDVLHLINFANIPNSLERKFLVSVVLAGAEAAGSADNIKFINFE